ncbi:MAG: CAP domain-containing protein [Pseudomonadota bacterium]
MLRLFPLLFAGLLALAACAPAEFDNPATTGASGGPPPKLYRIRSGETSKIQFRMLDSVNSLRAASGFGPVQLNAQLNAAAATHSRDMAAQNRPWHFGSDGSSPIDRAARAGYTGRFLGEAISETYETEIETLGAWMAEPGSRSVVLDPAAVNMGFAWFQERNGKIWWTLVTGG